MTPFPVSPVALISIFVGGALGLGLLYFAWVSYQEEGSERPSGRWPLPCLVVGLIGEYPWVGLGIRPAWRA